MNLLRRPPQTAAEPSRIAHFRQLIVSDDFDAIEAARGAVQSADILALIELYGQLETWPQRRAWVELLQDQFHPELPQIMLDFLRAPVTAGDEPMELAQAVALGFVDEQYDRFMTYYHDRDLLARDVQKVLRQRGLRQEAVAEPAKPAASPTPPPPAAARSPSQRLMDGAIAGDMTAVQQALADGAEVNATIGGGDYHGCSALMMALMRQRFDVADLLIAQGANVNHKRPAQHTQDPERGQTPLWWAANHGHLPLAQRLLDKGADVNTPDHHGSTPLTTAASSGHLPMVRFLLEAGADQHARIYDGRKAFNLAITNGHKDVAAFLLTRGNNPNETASSGYSPLMIAAENNFYDLAKLLIAKGADVNAVHPGPGIYAGLRGWTPLIFAVRAGYVRMTKLLIRAGANVQYVVPATKSYHGDAISSRRVIDFAQGKRAESIRKLLQEAGA